VAAVFIPPYSLFRHGDSRESPYRRTHFRDLDGALALLRRDIGGRNALALPLARSAWALLRESGPSGPSLRIVATSTDSDDLEDVLAFD